MNINEYKGIAVFVEQHDSELASVGLELICEARKLADIYKEEVIGIILGNNIKSLTNEIISYGADKVLYVDNSNLKEYSTEPYAQALYKILQDIKPNIVLLGATSTGRDLAPRLSARLNTGLTADCTKLAVKMVDVDGKETIAPNKELLMTRPTFGGNLIATIICPEHRPQMSTVRPGVMQKSMPDSSRKGTVEEVTIDFDTSQFKVKILKVTKEKSDKKDITEHSILISGGRGIKNQELYKKLEDMAEYLDCGVATSRGLVDKGWADHDLQVGQTGKTVRPDIYFAFGISGAIQHVAGMEESEYIIAINKDKNAPIFNYADLGLVCDLEPVINGLNNELVKYKK